ncbi:MAG: hypothetical protein IPQ27_09965 [Chitinophagaceae bacterium]|nr:hypothetical protein [Chitinophagaceae bacterium]
MKKLKRDELKNIYGGRVPASGLCDDYSGQTTWICGTNSNSQGCFVDYCSCATGQPIQGGCGVKTEDMSLCN